MPGPDDPSAPEDDSELATHEHDAYFKSVFSDPVHAIAFFKSHLPPALAAALNWPAL